MESQQIFVLIITLLALGAFTFIPQWRARRKRREQLSNLRVGDKIMTIGGLIGTLTALDVEENRARVEISPGVDIQITIDGISHLITAETA